MVKETLEEWRRFLGNCSEWMGNVKQVQRPNYDYDKAIKYNEDRDELEG